MSGGLRDSGLASGHQRNQTVAWYPATSETIDVVFVVVVVLLLLVCCDFCAWSGMQETNYRSDVVFVDSVFVFSLSAVVWCPATSRRSTGPGAC